MKSWTISRYQPSYVCVSNQALDARSTTTTARVSQSQRSRPGMIKVFVLLVLVALRGRSPRSRDPNKVVAKATTHKSGSELPADKYYAFALQLLTSGVRRRCAQSVSSKVAFLRQVCVTWQPNRRLREAPDPAQFRRWLRYSVRRSSDSGRSHRRGSNNSSS